MVKYEIIKNLINTIIKNGELVKRGPILWLVIADDKEWVFEYGGGVLWYNFSFFTDVFRYVNESPLDHHHTIHQWFIDTCDKNFDMLPRFSEKTHILDFFPSVTKIKKVSWRKVENYTNYVDEILNFRNLRNLQNKLY